MKSIKLLIAALVTLLPGLALAQEGAPQGLSLKPIDAADQGTQGGSRGCRILYKKKTSTEQYIKPREQDK